MTIKDHQKDDKSIEECDISELFNQIIEESIMAFRLVNQLKALKRTNEECNCITCNIRRRFDITGPIIVIPLNE